ncbi:hypothetical protein ACTFIT_002247 [Dictyostelium discoideum]
MIFKLLILLIFIKITFINTLITKSYYVNKSGSDFSGNGTIDNPFKSLCNPLLSIINEIKDPYTNVNVFIGNGYYYNLNCTKKFNNNNINIISFSPYKENYNQSDITISNFNFQVINSIVQFIRLKLIYDIENNGLEKIKINDNAQLIISGCEVTLENQLKSSYFIHSNRSHIGIINSNIKSSSKIMYIEEDSSGQIRNCIFKDIISNQQSIVVIDSYLNTEDVIFENIYSIGTSFLTSNSSTVTFNNCSFSNLIIDGFHPFSTTSDSLINFSGFTIKNSFFQRGFLRIKNSNTSIENGVFLNNKAYGFNLETDSLIIIEDSDVVDIFDCSFKGNSISSFFFFNNSKVMIQSSTFIDNISTFLVSNNSFVFVVDVEFSNCKSSLSKFLFSLYQSNSLLDRISIFSNSFMGSVVQCIECSLTFEKLKFQDNEFFKNPLYFNDDDDDISDYNDNDFPSAAINIKDGHLNIVNSTFQSNIHWSNNLIRIKEKSDINFTNTLFINNEIKKENFNLISIDYSILRFKSINFKNTKTISGAIGIFNNSLFGSTNSNYSNNYCSQSGSIFYFNNNSNFINSTTNANDDDDDELTNNTFTNNHAIISGGVLFSMDSIVLDIQDDKFNNTFSNNSAFFGNIYASNPTSIRVELPSTTNLRLESTIKLYDQYENLIIRNVYDIQVIVTMINNNNGSSTSIIKTFNTAIKNGFGLFDFSFKTIDKNGESIYIYSNYYNFTIYTNISLPNIPNYNGTFILDSSNLCPLQYQYYDNGECKFCPVGTTLSSLLYASGKASCVNCFSNTVCLGSMVYTFDNYYLLIDNKTAIGTYQCPVGMCGNYGSCIATQNTGLLCLECVDGNSKNGFYCCSSSSPWLIIVYIIFIILFGLSFSLIKYCDRLSISIFKSTIVFFQINSMIFYAYPGLYFIQLFRFSIDFISNICIFNKFNYIYKSMLTLISIIIVIGLSQTHISLTILIKLNLFPKWTKKLLLKSKKLTNNYNNNNNFNSIYNLYLILFQPIIYNLISILSVKNINGKKFLSIDPSTSFLENSHFKVVISFIIIISILLLLSIPVILIISNFKKINFLIIKNYYYKKSFKYWDLLWLLINTLICIFSITLLYSPNHQIIVIFTIVSIFSFLNYYFEPQRNPKIYQFENFINLLRIIIISIVGSFVFQSIPLKFNDIEKRDQFTEKLFYKFLEGNSELDLLKEMF